MKYLLLVLIFVSGNTFATTYFGANVGYNMFSTDTLDEYKVNPKGMTYGGFLGIGRDFVGLEFVYQDLKSEGTIKHDGGTYDITENATAMGAALRFSFEVLYLRLGVARYKLDQSLAIDDATVRTSAEALYEIQDEGTTKNGAIYGLGLHRKFGKLRTFIDYTRYQINEIGHYDTFSIGVVFSFSDNFFSSGKY